MSIYKLAVIGFTALAFTACNNNSTNDEAAEVAIATLADIGGYAVNVSSALLSQDDNFDVYFCYGNYYILNDTGDDYDFSGSASVQENQTSLNVWEEWPAYPADINIITADTVNPGSLVEGQTYDLEWWEDDSFAGNMTVNVIDTVDCATLPIPAPVPE